MNLKNTRSKQTSTSKSFNLTQFMDKFCNNPEAQRETFMSVKHPNGYVCPECGNTEYSWVKNRSFYQCKKCYHQSYLLVGTIFQGSKLSLHQILLEIYFLYLHKLE